MAKEGERERKGVRQKHSDQTKTFMRQSLTGQPAKTHNTGAMTNISFKARQLWPLSIAEAVKQLDKQKTNNNNSNNEAESEDLEKNQFAMTFN